MPYYYIEGLYASPQGVKKKRKTGVYPKNAIEPYARTIWANTPKDAIQKATDELKGGEWTEGPHLSQVTEEQRMRSLGAPQLPGFQTLAGKKSKRK
jgi:hypothetical protein